MEFNFNINHLFGETVTVVDCNLQPCRSTGEHLRGNMEKVINEMGQASAKAQSLHGPITSAHKLRFSNHHLYVMKDGEANGGLGAAVGILKTGRKKLFVLDAHGNQIEMEPLCVLDFYVHESCQRKGYGKQLFQKMLSHEGIQAQHLPIDRPSHKFTSFLTKHYNLRATIHQVNNFVIFDGFFRGQPEESFVRKRSSAVGNRKPPVAPIKRDVQYSGYRNASSAALWSHGAVTARRNSLDNPTTATPTDQMRDVPLPGIGRSGSAGSISSQGSGGSRLSNGTPEMKDATSRAYGAQANNYSRYQSGTPPSPIGRAGKASSSPIATNTTRLQNTSPITPGSGGGAREATPPIGRGRNATPPFGRPNTFGVNSHLTTRTRDGHLKLSPVATTTVPGGKLGQSPVLPGIGSLNGTQNPSPDSSATSYSPGTSVTKEGNYCLTPQKKTMHSSWNILGIPPSQPQGQGNGTHRSPHNISNRPW
ncbi:alpha-tubulin N-acetyltransferase-like [Asterias amurensis]|uniref:alpha-tubulin N-acetyltransferase-like n=1 Tax=Asterias amurensis TaxID=7602 RepID=UPI003AB7FAA3